MAQESFSNEDIKKVEAFFSAYCGECHYADPGYGDFGFADDLSRIRDAFVIPKQAEDSIIWQVLDNSSGEARMPPDYAEKAIADNAERDLIKRWIQAGAPTGSENADYRKFISPDEIIRLITRDLQTIDVHERSQTRYVSLAHYYNWVSQEQYQISDEQMTAFRYGVSKFINSLSWKEDVVPPQVVPGSSGALLRVNLGNYGNIAGAVGLRHLASYQEVGLGPSGWEKIGQRDSFDIFRYRYDLQDIKRMTHSDYPILRADVLVARGGYGQLYYELMGLMPNLQEIERSLLGGYTTLQRLQSGHGVLRAGFNDSGVSSHNRLIERHPISLYPDAAYWLSYDFSSSSDDKILTKFPLGPVHAFPVGSRYQFNHDGGEVIFNLPNGLQAYILANAQGKIIETAPEEIVQDPKRTTVQNAISCMDCHSGGLIEKADDIRHAVEANPGYFDSLATAYVRQLYPLNYENGRLSQAFRNDSGRFKRATEKAKLTGENVVSLKGGDPAAQIYDRFIYDKVDIARLAAELSLPEKDIVLGLRRYGDAFPGLTTLLKAKGKVNRDTLAENFYTLVESLKSYYDGPANEERADDQGLQHLGSFACYVKLVGQNPSLQSFTIKGISNRSAEEAKSEAWRRCAEKELVLNNYKCQESEQACEAL